MKQHQNTEIRFISMFRSFSAQFFPNTHTQTHLIYGLRYDRWLKDEEGKTKMKTYWSESNITYTNYFFAFVVSFQIFEDNNCYSNISSHTQCKWWSAEFFIPSHFIRLVKSLKFTFPQFSLTFIIISSKAEVIGPQRKLIRYIRALAHQFHDQIFWFVFSSI